MDVNIFFSKPVKKQAVKVCESCPVVEQCAENAIINESFGYVGGMSDKERYYERRRRGLPEPEMYDRDVIRVIRSRRPGSNVTYFDIVHGTNKGYSQEKHGGWTPCDACKEAHRIYMREYRIKKEAEKEAV